MQRGWMWGEQQQRQMCCTYIMDRLEGSQSHVGHRKEVAIVWLEDHQGKVWTGDLEKKGWILEIL